MVARVDHHSWSRCCLLLSCYSAIVDTRSRDGLALKLFNQAHTQQVVLVTSVALVKQIRDYYNQQFLALTDPGTDPNKLILFDQVQLPNYEELLAQAEINAGTLLPGGGWLWLEAFHRKTVALSVLVSWCGQLDVAPEYYASMKAMSQGSLR